MKLSPTIVPAIIGEQFSDVRTKYERVGALVDWVQVDIVDGLFAQPASWPYKHDDDMGALKSRLAKPPRHAKVELHLMVENPESGLEKWIDSGAQRLLIHHEATPRINELVDTCVEGRVGPNGHNRMRFFPPSAEVGVVLKMETPVEVLEKMIQPICFVQLMSIRRIGSYGAEFDDAVYPKIEAVRKRYPNATISIDGGVTLENAPHLVEAGANQLVVGSAIWRAPDIREAIHKFQKIA